MNFRMYFIGLVLGGVVLFGCGETKDVGVESKKEIEKPKIATSKTVKKYKNFGNTYLKAPTPPDSVKIFVFNKFYHVKKQPYQFIKIKSHSGLYALRTNGIPREYILYDSVANIIKQENIREQNPFRTYNFPKLKQYLYSSGEPKDLTRGDFYSINRNLNQKEKELFIPNSLIPNYTDDIVPVYLKTIQFVSGLGRFYDIPKSTLPDRRKYFVAFELRVYNKDFTVIKMLHQINLMSENGTLIRDFWFDDLGYLTEVRLSLDQKELIVRGGGSVCCEGEGSLKQPFFGTYDIKTGELIKETPEYPYKKN